MTTTGAAAGKRSVSTMARPNSGWTLATRKPAAEISATATSSTDPSAVMTLRWIVWNAPISSTDFAVPIFERKRTQHDDVECGEDNRRDADRDGHRQPADQRQSPAPDQQAEPEL